MMSGEKMSPEEMVEKKYGDSYVANASFKETG